MRYLIFSVALLTLAACDPTIPDSATGVDTGAGVGFGSYTEYQRATAGQSAGQTSVAQATANTGSGATPIQASPSNPAPVVVGRAAMSDEASFERVETRRSIEDDAAQIAVNRAQYQQIEPTALPTRSGASTGGIVQYALSTTHPVGTKIHKRISLNSAAKYTRNCAKFQSPDMAQIEFLAKGGPARDRLGIDPDGDGYACTWNPVPFRKAVNG